jgi:hypothetical protein
MRYERPPLAACLELLHGALVMQSNRYAYYNGSNGNETTGDSDEPSPVMQRGAQVAIAPRRVIAQSARPIADHRIAIHLLSGVPCTDGPMATMASRVVDVVRGQRERPLHRHGWCAAPIAASLRGITRLARRARRMLRETEVVGAKPMAALRAAPTSFSRTFGARAIVEVFQRAILHEMPSPRLYGEVPSSHRPRQADHYPWEGLLPSTLGSPHSIYVPA